MVVRRRDVMHNALIFKDLTMVALEKTETLWSNAIYSAMR